MHYRVRTTFLILFAAVSCGARAADIVNQEKQLNPPVNKEEGEKKQQTIAPDSVLLAALATESKVLDIAVLALLAKKTGNVVFQQQPNFVDKMWIVFLTAAVFLRKDSMLTTGTSLCDGSQGFATWWSKSLNADPTRTLAITVMAVTGGCIIGNYLFDCVDSLWERVKKNSHLQIFWRIGV